MDIHKAMKNPASIFGTPEALSESRELTPEQKRAILLQWKDQLQQLQAADDEGMQKIDIRCRIPEGIELLRIQEHHGAARAGVEGRGVKGAILASDAHDMPTIKAADAAAPLSGCSPHRAEA